MSGYQIENKSNGQGKTVKPMLEEEFNFKIFICDIYFEIKK